MTLTKVLVFDISGEYAHFRKFNTTSSPLTYNIPTRPALSGLLGAVLGIERETSPDVFSPGTTPVNELFHPNRCAIAIQLISKIKKSQIGFNLLDTSKQGSSFFNIKNRTQIEFEFLKDVTFRIYLYHEDAAIMQDLTHRIKNKQHHFTPYLGLAQLTADINFVGIQSCEHHAANDKTITISSAVNLSSLPKKNPVVFEKEGYYSVDTFPIVMRRNREVATYAELLVERTGRDGPKLKVNCEAYYRVNNEVNILFL